ncbi:MAG: 6-phosphogluconolactonase [Thermodesulfobacteriota bacterium]
MRELVFGHTSSGKKGTKGGSRIRVLIYKDLEELSRAGAALFLESAIEETEAKRYFTVLLSGGRTPQRLYELLTEDEYKDKISWSDTYLFWGDERCVNLTHPDSNYRMVSEALLCGVEIPPENIHAIAGELKEGAAFLYEEEVKSFFETHNNKYVKFPVFDFALMGLGSDGHILSLFPNTSALGATSRILMDVHVKEALVSHRVTMTIPVINKASKIIFLVSGEGKSEILKSTLEGDYDPRRFPAHGLKPDKGEIIYLVDEAAASLLS